MSLFGGVFSKKQQAVIYKIAFLEAMALSLVIPSVTSTGEVTIANSCTGLLLQYGRCEQNQNGVSVTIPPSGSTLLQVNYTIPFTHAPTPVVFEQGSGVYLTTFDDILLSQNGTVGNGRTFFTFPAANTIGILPSGSGYLTISGAFNFAGQIPVRPTYAMLSINVNTLSTTVANGRNVWVQAFDADNHGDGSCNGVWENLGADPTKNRPGIKGDTTGTWTATFQHGDIFTFSGVDTGSPSLINQTIISDNANAYHVCGGVTGTSGDTQLRVVGAVTSGTEVMSYSQLYITFWFPVAAIHITLIGFSTTSFTINISGPPGVVVIFSWKAVSENG